MKLNTRMRYGTMFLFELALNYGKGCLQLNEAARSQNISEKYLEQIASNLKSSGLIQAQRGAKGGYVLSKEPSAINMREIAEKLEGTLSLVECLEKPSCGKTGRCPAQNVWKKVSDVMKENLENITLSDIVDDYKRKSNSSGYEI